ncbi:Ash protein family [Yersinia aleksiciae]|nr:Ash protein family [Yersinia aleksiciae]
MPDKTKAALQGRQCQNTYINHNQISISAGPITRVADMQLGQEMNYGYKLTAPLAQFNRDTRKLAHTGNSTHLKSIAGWWVSPNLDRPFYTQPIGVCLLPLWGSMAMADTQRRNSGLAEGEIPPSKQNQSVSFAFLRWRRLISPLAAVTRKPAVLSPSSFSCSISTITSCGIRTVVICDFAFFAPVAITGSPYVRCMSVYAKIIIKKGLKCISLECSVKSQGDIHLKITKPGSVSPLTGPLTTNDRMSIEVAMLNHTQTRPKYQYRFLALHRSDRSAAPCRLSVEAFTEKEARQVLSAHFILSLAARLPVQEVRHA